MPALTKMADLTQRQIQILKCVVEEYISTALPVGSDVLERKYNLGVSPATIRNEMAALTASGYLRQPHTSAGRTPSPMALKLYVDTMMEEKKLTTGEEVAAKEKVMANKNDFSRLMQDATKALSVSTGCLAVAATEAGEVWHAGYSHILDQPEFYNIDVTGEVLALLEQSKRLHQLFFEHGKWSGGETVEILFGEELGWDNFDAVAIVASHFATPHGDGSIGIIGPVRFNYPVVVPVVRYYSDLVTEISSFA
ncbi:MAG: hypothetical protein Q7S79_01395 [bacterium]|nr:hypothetical protein [bacterium]